MTVMFSLVTEQFRIGYGRGSRMLRTNVLLMVQNTISFISSSNDIKLKMVRLPNVVFK